MLTQEIQLTSEHKKLVQWALTRFAREYLQTHWCEDLRQAGYYGLIRALRRCDPYMEWRPYCVPAIIHAIQYQKKKIRKRGFIGDCEPLVDCFSEIDQPHVPGSIADKFVDYRLSGSNLDFYDAIQDLSDREQSVVCGSYLYDQTDTEMAAHAGVSKQAINTVKLRAISKLRQRLAQ